MALAAAPATPPHSRHEHTVGLAYGVLAYTWWGFFPIYFKAIATVSPVEVLCHRVVWAVILLAGLSWRGGRLAEIASALRARRTRALLSASTVLIAINWLVYIYAVVTGRVLEGSLGYYINPLVSVLLGVVVLKERLTRRTLVAVSIAGIGVLAMALQMRQAPWIPVTLALSFGLYGLMRKLAPVAAVTGVTVETLLLLPLAVAFLAWTEATGRAVFLSSGRGTDVLLVLAGPMTAIPLLWFTGAARRLPLSTLGFLQYLSPTLQFLLAVLLYHEPFTAARGVAFACIWVALAVFAVTPAPPRPERGR
jgi:chloramphenicol-sensitive protein RarD